MKKYKKISAVILSFLCAAALTSCGNKTENISDTLEGENFSVQEKASFEEITAASETSAKTILSEETANDPALTCLAYEPLSAEAEKNLREDFFAVFALEYPNWTDLTADDMSIEYYYGTYDSGEVVVMYPKGFAYTDDIKYYSVAGYDFYLPSGSFEITLHKDSEFISLDEAYDSGYLTDDDMEEIYFHSQINYPYAYTDPVYDIFDEEPLE